MNASKNLLGRTREISPMQSLQICALALHSFVGGPSSAPPIWICQRDRIYCACLSIALLRALLLLPPLCPKPSWWMSWHWQVAHQELKFSHAPMTMITKSWQSQSFENSYTKIKSSGGN